MKPFIAIQDLEVKAFREILDAIEAEWHAVEPFPEVMLLRINNLSRKLVQHPLCRGVVSPDLLSPTFPEVGGHVGACLNISNRYRLRSDLFHVLVDDEEIGELAANHLWERGCREAAVLIENSYEYARIRGEKFESVFRNRGGKCRRINLRKAAHLDFERNADYVEARYLEVLKAWQADTGLFVTTDLTAAGLLLLAEEKGMLQEGYYPLIGVDDVFGDHPAPYHCPKPLTTIKPPFPLVGKCIAEYLRQQMHCPEKKLSGKRFCRGAVLIERASTLQKGNADPFVARGLHWMQEALSHGNVRPVSELAEELGVSTRTLHHHFQAALGVSPQACFMQQRLKKAAELLKTSADTVGEIAFRTGFNQQATFARRFKQEFSCSPRGYRKQTL